MARAIRGGRIVLAAGLVLAACRLLPAAFCGPSRVASPPRRVALRAEEQAPDTSVAEPGLEISESLRFGSSLTGMLKPVLQAQARFAAGDYDQEAIRSEIEAESRSAPVVMYTLSQSPFSIEAKRLLEESKVVSTIRTRAWYSFFDDPSSNFLLPNHGNDYITITTRSKHSSTQIKRLFKKNPAKRRIALKQQTGLGSALDPGVILESTIPPTISEKPKILSNGWNVPASDESDVENDESNQLPFKVARTKNKPNNAVGFLPVYSEHRKDGARVTTRIKKVSGDRGLFLNELRAALEIPIPKNPREDTIRIRTGGTIEIKGNRVLEVKTWLAGLGF